MAKPRKKHSLLARQNRQAMHLTKNIVVAWCTPHIEPLFFSLQGNQIHVSDLIKNLVMQAMLPWSSLCLVLCRDQNRTQYIKSLPIHSRAPYKYETLAPTMNNLHQDLLNEGNEFHLVNAGWVASPVGKEVDDVLAEKIMTNLRGWELPAKWEEV